LIAIAIYDYILFIFVLVPMDSVRHGKIQGQRALKKTEERPSILPCLT
jgi:hypothetical protein